MNEIIEIVPYDPTWPAQFAAEQARLRNALGDVAVAIEHIGSTAVPGLGAKPIIDILIGVRDLHRARESIGAIQALGYQYVPEFERVIPERLYFRKGVPRSHQIHLVEVGGEFWRRHLLFRNYLRDHPEAAQAYERLKRDLAQRHATNRNAYTDAKTDFIAATVAQAEQR